MGGLHSSGLWELAWRQLGGIGGVARSTLGRHARKGLKRVFERKGDIGLPRMGSMGMAKAAVWVGYWRPVADGQSKELKPRDWSNPKWSNSRRGARGQAVKGVGGHGGLVVCPILQKGGGVQEERALEGGHPDWSPTRRRRSETFTHSF